MGSHTQMGGLRHERGTFLAALVAICLVPRSTSPSRRDVILVELLVVGPVIAAIGASPRDTAIVAADRLPRGDPDRPRERRVRLDRAPARRGRRGDRRRPGRPAWPGCAPSASSTPRGSACSTAWRGCWPRPTRSRPPPRELLEAIGAPARLVDLATSGRRATASRCAWSGPGRPPGVEVPHFEEATRQLDPSDELALPARVWKTGRRAGSPTTRPIRRYPRAEAARRGRARRRHRLPGAHRAASASR